MGDVPRDRADINQQSSPDLANNARDAFEREWIAGKRPRIEDCLVQMAEPLRTNLFRELVALEVEHRFGRGEEPNLNEYISRFPQDGKVLSEVFSRRQPPSDPSSEKAHSSEENAPGTDQGKKFQSTLMISYETPSTDADKNVISKSQSVKILDSVQGGRSDCVETPPDSSATANNAAESHYEMIENFAHGGMGNIWRSRDTRIRREVAYKVLLPKLLKSKEIVERFVQEAQVTGQLEHPGIVPIYDLGWQENGTPFYTMKLVRGHTLNESMTDYHALADNHSEKRIKLIKLLRNFIAVCNALAFAHERRVLHRDLKPDNIMLGDFGETLVLDWGLAKLIEAPSEDASIPGEDEPSNSTPRTPVEIQPTDVNYAFKETLISANDTDLASAESSKSAMSSGSSSRSFSRESNFVSTNARSAESHTSLGSIMGTVAYMSPEQALGQISELDPRSDIYCLGTILYEILTGQRAVEKGPVPNMIKKVVVETPKEPREVNRSVPKSLNAICMKALQKVPADRYQKTLEFSKDVEAYLADEPVSAYAEPWHVRAGRWCRRHRTAVWSCVTSLVVIVLGIVSWNAVENHRLAKIRANSNATISSAQRSIEAEDFDEAKALLSRVAGDVETEPALNDLKLSVRRELENVDRLRIGAVRRKVELQIASAETAIQQQNYEEAGRLLTEATTGLADEIELADLSATAETRLKEVINYLNIQEAQAEAQETFTEFQHHADRARFYGSLFTGESVEQDTADAKKHALLALKLYGFESSVAADISPEHLSADQVQKLKTDAFELMLIVAESTVTLTRHASTDEQQTAAGLALDWIQKAKRFEIPCKTALLREADYLGRLGKTQEQNSVNEQTLDTEPVIALDFFLLAEAQRKQRNFEKALPLYLDALRIDPDHFWSIHFRALCHLQRIRPAAAEEAYSACIALRPTFPWNFLLRGIAFAEMGQFENAYADFEKAIELEPELMGIYVNRGAVYLKQKNYKAAIADFKHAAELRPDRADPLINLAETYRLQEEYESALLALTKAEAIAPNHPSIFRMRGDIRMRMLEPERAKQDFLMAITREVLPHRIAYCYEQVGRIFAKNRQWSQAIEACNRALAAQPGNAAVHHLRAEVFTFAGNDEEAILDFSRYLELTQPNIDVYLARGLARAKLGRYHEAINDYTRVLELRDSPNILTRRGWTYLLQANKLALKDFDKAIQLNPENADSYNGRGYAKVMLDDYQGACADAEQAVEKAQKQIALQGASTWPLIYNAATIYAQAVDRVEKDDEQDKPKRDELASQYTKRAVELISKAMQIAQGLHKSKLVQTIKADSALDPIRGRPEFQQASLSWLSPSLPESSVPKSETTP